ncbi:MAG: glutamate--cysteine ligase [Leptospiraceae bacterium]|nr:glutamate--cysteine ligase [Leptospiraceae bacterium]
MNRLLAEKLYTARDSLDSWLKIKEEESGGIFYSSVDVRDAGFKAAIVDTNLYPAGFNNIHVNDRFNAATQTYRLLEECLNAPKSILLVIEEHTRNKWYLENVVVLKELLSRSGATVTFSTAFQVEGETYDGDDSLNLESISGKALKVYTLEKALAVAKPDIVILNNDLMKGIPEPLLSDNLKVYPSPKAGWHSRLKSRHFHFMDSLASTLAERAGLDPWFITSLWRRENHVDINIDADRERLADNAAELLKSIAEKYKEYEIDSKPFLFLKADYGTYGMGLLPVEDASEIAGMNRKNKNRLFKGKSARVIDSFILQEGVPTIIRRNEKPAEVCLYQIGSQTIGSFFRINNEKNDRENLNSTGMIFEPFELGKSSEYGICEKQMYMYKTMTRLAGLSARLEINELQNNVGNEVRISC